MTYAIRLDRRILRGGLAVTLALLTTASCASVPESRASVSEPDPAPSRAYSRNPNAKPGPGGEPGP